MNSHIMQDGSAIIGVFKRIPLRIGQCLILQIAVLTLLLSFLAHPLWQRIHYGYFLYSNGHDEASYLCYDFSLESKEGRKRLVSFLVPLLHESGFSGGSINFMFDFAALLLIGILVPKVLAIYFPTVRPVDRFFAAFLVCFLPLLFTELNPLMEWCISMINASALLQYYVVWGHGNEPVYLRTPESQFSIVVFLLVFWALSKRGRPLFAILVAPLLYFFVGIFVASLLFVYGVSVLLVMRFRSLFNGVAVAVASLLLLLLSGLAQASIFARAGLGGLVLGSRAPVVGVNLLCLTAGYCLILVFRRRLNIRQGVCHFLAAMVGAIWVIYNTQLVSGVVTQPQHFEFECGVAIAVMASAVLLGMPDAGRLAAGRWLYGPVAAAVLVFLGLNLFHAGAFNQEAVERFEVLRKAAGFEEALREQPHWVALNDVELSTRIGGLYLAKGGAIATGLQPVFKANSGRYQHFLGLKNYISRLDDETRKQMDPVVNRLMPRYQDRHHNFLTLYRARRPPVRYDYSGESEQIPSDDSPFKIYLVPSPE